MAEKPGNGRDPAVRGLTGNSAPGLEQEHGDRSTDRSSLRFCDGRFGALECACRDRSQSLEFVVREVHRRRPFFLLEFNCLPKLLRN